VQDENHEDHDDQDGDDDAHVPDHDEHPPVDPAVVAARRARLADSLDAITVDDLNAHLAGAPSEVRQALMKRLSVRLDPKFIKGGVGRLIRTRLRTLSPDKQVEMAAELTAGIDQEAATFLGEESFNAPTPEDLDRLITHLLESHRPVMVRTYLACTAAAEAPVADELDRLLTSDARVAAVTPG